MDTLSKKILESINSSTFGRAICGPAGGLSYFARQVLPLMHPQLTIVRHRLYKENNLLKQQQGLLASVVGPSKVKSDLWLFSNMMLGQRIVEGLIENKVDLLVIDGGEHGQEDFNEVITVVRQELRDQYVKCGILILSRQMHFDTLALGDATDVRNYRVGFVFNVGKLDVTQTASIVAHWMPWDTGIKTRLAAGDSDTLDGVQRIHGYTFGEFELVEDFIECLEASSPGGTLSKSLVEDVIRWKTSN